MSDYQVGVFPITEDGRVVLITSRGRGDWIFPKGKCEKGRSDRAVARDEAYEEAGLFGEMKQQYEEFETPSKGFRKLRIFRMKVNSIISKFPEVGQRQRAVVSMEKAEKMLPKDLRAILRGMADNASWD